MIEAENQLVFDALMQDDCAEKTRVALAAMLGVAPRFDLACVGISIHGLGASTFEAIACLATADVVYCYPRTAAHFELLKLINSNLINLHENLYSRGSDFDPAYDAIIKEVMSAVRSGKKVAYATQGSPAFHCGTAASLHRHAKREGFCSILVPGVSSFEILSTDLASDYDITNIQICSIIRLVQGGISINPHVPCLLFDLGRYALAAIGLNSNSVPREKLSALGVIMRNVYPSNHEMILMHVTATGFCSKLVTTAQYFEDAVIKFGTAVTVFAPAIA